MANTQKMTLSVFDQLLTIVETEETAQVSLFGTFELKKRMERVLVNPNTGKKLMVPPKLVLGFKAAASLKEKAQKGGDDE